MYIVYTIYKLNKVYDNNYKIQIKSIKLVK